MAGWRRERRGKCEWDAQSAPNCYKLQNRSGSLLHMWHRWAQSSATRAGLLWRLNWRLVRV